MRALEELKEEHEAIKLMLKILEKISEKLDSGEIVDTDHLEKIVEFIQVFADRCHHRKEEDLLFREMEAVGFPRDRGPVGVMLHEHEIGRGYVRNIKEGVAKLKAGDKKGALVIAENARGYVSLLSQHIDKEDNILYPMAENRLSEEKFEELGKGFEKVEKEIIGPGKHAEFHQLLHHLKEIYL